MSVPAFSVRQPVLVNLLAIVIVVAGVMIYRGMTREAWPEVGMDAAWVRTVYPGASSAEMESLFSRPIEEAVLKVDGVQHAWSTSAESYSFVWIEMESGVDDAARVVIDIQSEVSRLSDLPADADAPNVGRAHTVYPAMTVAVLGVAEAGRAPPGEHELRAVARRLGDRLELLPLVDSVWAAGVRPRQVRVEVDPTALESHNVALAQVAGAIAARDRDIPGGFVPLGQREVSLRALGAYETVAEMGDQVVRPDPAGDHVRVRDVARVEDGFMDAETGARVDGEPGVVLTVRKKVDADTTLLSVDLRRAIAEFESTLPAGFRVKIFGDAAEVVERGIGTVENNGLFGLLLVLVTLWLFLGVRNALMAALGMPVALLGGIVLMHVMGITINQISLFSLILCLGLVVDDAIVVVENAHRFHERGYSRTLSAYLGARQVFWPVISTVLTTVAAFLPLLLMTGMLGEFFSIIPKVVVAALLASLFECLVILPAHFADFAPHREPRVPGNWITKALKWLYARTFPPVLRHRYIAVLLVFSASAALVWYAWKTKEVVLFGAEDAELVDIRIELPEDTSLDETSRVLRKVEAIARSLPTDEVDAVVSQWGWTRLDQRTDRGRHLGLVTLFLRPPGERPHHSNWFVAELRREVALLPGPVRTDVSPLLFQPPTGKPVAIRLFGDDLARLGTLAAQVEEAVGGIEGTREVATDYSEGKAELRVRVDPARAALHGLSPGDVNAWIRTAYGGLPVSHFREGDEEMDVVLRLVEEARDDVESVGDLRLRTPLGGVVRLADVTDLESARGPSQIRRRDGKRTISVAANIDDAVTTSQVVNEAARARLATLIAGNPDVDFEFGGEFEETRKSLDSLLVAFNVAILVIFTILGAQFRSFVQPLVVIAAIPLAFIGVVVGFLVSGRPVDMIGLIGVVGLSGIAVNDSLILVDFINARRRLGEDRDHAIRTAGVERLRPVILTTVTTVGGLLPIAIGIGGKAERLAPMAVAIVWGLSFATFFTLYVIPCLYAIADDAVGLFLKNRQTHDPEWDEVEALDRLTDRELALRLEAEGK